MDENEYNYLFKKLANIFYEKQDHWDIFDDVYYNKVSNIKNLKNFRNNGISNMLETGLPSQDRFLMLKNNKSYNTNYNEYEIDDLLSRYDILKKMINDDLNKISFNSNIGNPRNYLYENKMLNFDDLYHVYATWQLNRFIKLQNINIETVVEIGGGYGNFANKLKSLNKKIKYIIIDLPEVLLLQHYYLLNNNKSYKIINLIDETKEIDVKNDDYDFILMPFNIYKNFNFSFDIIINKRSLGEMPKDILMIILNGLIKI